jgi:hypothetical protein
MGTVPKIASWDRLVTSAPLNKSAAMAMQGTDNDPTLSARQLRENLLPILAKIEEELKTAGREQKKLLGQKKFAIQNQLRALRPQTKRTPDYASRFHEAARDLLSKVMFRLVCEEAQRRCDNQIVPECPNE